jgi:outer membrane protein TolC
VSSGRCLILVALLAGCATRSSLTQSQSGSASVSDSTPSPARESSAKSREPSADQWPEDAVVLASTESDESQQAADPSVLVETADVQALEEIPVRPNVSLEDVIGSVYTSFPLLQAAIYSRNVAWGEQLAAQGGFDLKLKAASENGPTGYYETYRHSIGMVQPLYGGADVFAGYRVGRGYYQPWYLERQTNDGGELKAGVLVPFARNREIDARRADLFRAGYGLQIVEPEIQAQLIGFVLEASYAYWDWVAACQKLRIADRVLSLALDRTDRIAEQVDAGLIDPPELTDNLRLVAERRGYVAGATRQLREKSVKLSLYYRDLAGAPAIVSVEQAPDFPKPEPTDFSMAGFDAALAVQARPELKVLALTRRQYEVDYRQAQNDTRPNIDGVLTGSQDVGEPTSSKRDKSQFEAEASVFVDTPLQRRKGFGKMQAIEGKIAQINAKSRMVEDKIVAEVRAVYAAIEATAEQAVQAALAVKYAEELAARERKNFEEGASDLLKVTLREQYAAESAIKQVEALQMHFEARADYRAILAQDGLQSLQDAAN